MNSIQFDVDKIITIKFRRSYLDNGCQWRTDLTIKERKKFLGFTIKEWEIKRPDGFYYNRWCPIFNSNSKLEYISIDVLKLLGYNIVATSKGNEAWKKPYVEIKLINGDEIDKLFDSNAEALEWIEKLKVWSNKKFEVIEN